ncbi:MAG: Lrp/AsnC family transcriptional regulator, partial [Caldimonas sp.]
TPCLRRVKRLEESGAITGYRAELDRGKVGLGVTAFVHVNLDKHGAETTRRFLAAVDAIDAVISCHALTGTFDFILEVVTGSMDEYATVMLNRLGGLPNVSAIQTSFCLRTTKHGQKLPVTHLGSSGD